MSKVGVILCLAVICISLYLIVKWWADILANTIQTEREEKLEADNIELRRQLKWARAENKRLNYERNHTRIEIKEM